jgi:hypothetical protein
MKHSKQQSQQSQSRQQSQQGGSSGQQQQSGQGRSGQQGGNDSGRTGNNPRRETVGSRTSSGTGIANQAIPASQANRVTSALARKVAIETPANNQGNRQRAPVASARLKGRDR